MTERELLACLDDANCLLGMAEKLAGVGHWRYDLETSGLFWSEEIYRAHGLTPADGPTLESSLAAYAPGDRERVASCIRSAISHGKPFSYEARLLRPDGSLRDVLVLGEAGFSPSGRVVDIFGVLQDISERKAAEREREELSSRISFATQSAGVGIWDWDFVTGTILWDKVMFALYGYPGRESTASYELWSGSLHPDDRARAEAEVTKAAADGTSFVSEFRVVWPSGTVRYIRALANVICDESGAGLRMIGTNWDVTEVHHLAAALRLEQSRLAQTERAATFAAAHDPLTGLLNRRGLREWIDVRAGLEATLLYLDLDDFKLVNDRGGHIAGDALLEQVAGIVRESAGAGDACARMGGDEFLVVLCGPGNARRAADASERITAALADLKPLGSRGDAGVGVSIGTCALAASGRFTDALRNADADLCERKERHHTAERKLAAQRAAEAAHVPLGAPS